MKALIVVFISLLYFGCSSTPQGVNLKSDSKGSGEKIEGPINISEMAPYKLPDLIEDSIKEECTDLPNKISSFTKQFSEEKGLKINLVKSVDKDAKGNNVVLETLNAVSKGNAFLGHQKHVVVQASLYANGKLVDEVKIQRDSKGGFGAGFKGSCSVLGRCAEALGEDLSLWLAKYSKDSK